VLADYRSTVLADTPLAFYPLDLSVDTSGTATDVSGNSNDGSYVNITSGINNAAGPSAFITNSINFDGTATSVDLSPAASLTSLSGAATLEVWVQPADSTSFGDIIAKGYDSSTYQESYIRVDGPYGAFYDMNLGNSQITGGQQTTNWTHVVLANDGTTTSLYINGVLIQSKSDSVGAISFSDPWAIGNGTSAGNSRHFKGNISQVAIYSQGLTAAQVLNHYIAGYLGVPANNAIPLITAQPQSQPSYVGGSVTFSVGVLSALPTTNLWFKGGSPLTGKTNSTLVLSNLQPGDAGNYSVVVGNANGTTNSASASVTVATPHNLQWSANANSGVWDTATSPNWVNLANSSATVFNSGDTVLFNDTAGVPTSLNVSGTVFPSLITVNSTNNNFSITGGTIGGSGSLIKNGGSTLEISGANNFTGPVTISGGTVKMDEPLAGTATSLGSGSGAPIVVTNGATLAVNASGSYPGGNSGISTRAITISGSGVGGLGALQSVGNDIYHDGAPNGGLFRSLTLAGDATIGGSGRWDLGQEGLLTTIGTGGKNYNLTCLQGGYSEWHSVTIDTNLGNIDYTLASGNYWVLLGMGNSLGDPTNTITLHGNVTLQLQGNGNGQDNGYAKIIHVPGGSSFGYRPYNGTGDYQLATSLILDTGVTWYFFNVNGGSETGVNLGGKVTFNGVTHLSIGDGNVTLTNVINGPGGFVWDSYNHLLVFTAANIYSGPTVIGSGLTLALEGNGSIAQSALIFFGGNNPNSTRVDASGRSDSTLTLTSGQALGGIGAVTGNLIESAGATIAPAGTNITIGINSGANQTGAITATGNITLNGTTVLKLNGSGANDSVQAGGNLTYGGNLALANISGAPMAAGDTFQLFTAGSSISGSFAGITPTTPGAGLGWDTSQLGSGVLGVVSIPVFTNIVVSSGNIIVSGSGGSASGTFYVLTATNLLTPLTNWVVWSTNSYDSSGNFSVTNSVTTGTKQKYYRIKQ
jgi:autotransporter-associated beta strand protein